MYQIWTEYDEQFSPKKNHEATVQRSKTETSNTYYRQISSYKISLKKQQIPYHLIFSAFHHNFSHLHSSHADFTIIPHFFPGASAIHVDTREYFRPTENPVFPWR